MLNKVIYTYMKSFMYMQSLHNCLKKYVLLNLNKTTLDMGQQYP